MTGHTPYRRSDRTKAQASVFLEILKLAEDLQRGFTELFKQYDLSNAQFNVLRVLRGAGDEGLTCGDIASRLVQHDPDITRLLDRLEKRELIARHRSTVDRRVVRTRITQAGLDILAKLDVPVDELHEAQFGHLSEVVLHDALALINTLRGPAAQVVGAAVAERACSEEPVNG